MSEDKENMTSSDIERTPVKTDDNRRRLKPITARHFEKHSHRIKTALLEQLRKVVEIHIHRAATWKEIESIIDDLFIQMCKESDLPKKAANLKIDPSEERRKIAAMLGFRTATRMRECIEIGRRLEEGGKSPS